MEKNKLGCKNKDLWASYSEYKPKKWTVVDGKKKIYSQMVEVYLKGWPRKQIDFIKIEYKVIVDENYNKVLDTLHFRDYLNENFPKSFFSFDEGIFLRDTKHFPFILELETSYGNIYLAEKKTKMRLKKLENILDNEEN